MLRVPGRGFWEFALGAAAVVSRGRGVRGRRLEPLAVGLVELWLPIHYGHGWDGLERVWR